MLLARIVRLCVVHKGPPPTHTPTHTHTHTHTHSYSHAQLHRRAHTPKGLVFEINGVVNANLLAYTMPGFLGACAFRTEPWKSPDRLKPTLLFLFGMAVFVIGVTMIFVQKLGLE
jgi:hypothetical protein